MNNDNTNKLLTEVPLINNSKFLQEIVLKENQTNFITEKDKTLKHFYGEEPEAFTD